jgi:catechol 2,3-dioxygenase-like lactoylglutathione lyase family enzyme
MTATLRCEVFPADLDATVRFYVEVLGFQVVGDQRDVDSRYVALRRGAVRVGAALGPAVPDRGQRRPPAGVELVLEVDDLDAERARVAAAGWPVTEDLAMRPWGLRDFRVLDPDGYYWRITTPGPPPSLPR